MNKCSNCGYTWCGLCGRTASTFYVKGKVRCQQCYHPGYRSVMPMELFQFALEKLDMDEDQLLDQYKTTKRYRRDVEVAQCMECDQRPGCSTLEVRFYHDCDKLRETKFMAGVCCVCTHQNHVHAKLGKTCDYCIQTTLESHLAPVKSMWPKDLFPYFLDVAKGDKKLLDTLGC